MTKLKVSYSLLYGSYKDVIKNKIKEIWIIKYVIKGCKFSEF